MPRTRRKTSPTPFVPLLPPTPSAAAVSPKPRTKPSPPTATVRPRKAKLPSVGGAAEVISELRRAIMDGEYPFHARLPAERALGDHFRVSRGTVRNALQTLQDLNMVTRRRGAGTFVCHRDVSAVCSEDEIAEITSPLQLVEVRFAVEPQMARLAVLHAREQDLLRIGDALKALLASHPEAERFSRADETFHLCLAEATHNPLMQWIYRQINAIRGHRQWDACKDKILTPRRIARYNEQHAHIYQCLRRRDSKAVAAMIREHLKQARADLLGAGLG